MGLKTLLFKPRWQHKDPAIRAREVARSEDPRLINELSQIARSDADPDVRLAASRRVTHLDTLFAIASMDSAPAVSGYAWRQVRHQLETLPEGDSASVQLEILKQLNDDQMIEQLARKAQSTLLRGAAQERLTREGLLGDLAISDADPTLRMRAAGRVTSESTLRRIADGVRKRDKKLYRSVTDRLEALRVAAGDTEIVTDRAIALCQSLEHLAVGEESRQNRAAELNRIKQSFQGLSRDTKLPKELLARFESAATIAEATLSDPKEDPLAPLRAELKAFVTRSQQVIKGRELEPVKALLRSFPELDEKLQAEAPELREQLSEQLDLLTDRRQELLAEARPDPALVKLCETAERPGRRGGKADFVTDLRSRWQRTASTPLSPVNQELKQRFDAALEQHSTRQAEAAARRQQAGEAFAVQLETLERELDSGDVKQAAVALQRAQQHLNNAGKQHPESGRLTQLRGKLQEMRQWQRWSNDEVRQRLVEHAAAIPGSGMHPDAVAARVKELRGRWKELDVSERLAGDPPNRPVSPKLFREFQAACEAAFEPARQFFEKRAEVQNKHLDELNELCESLAGITPSGDNWDEISRAVGQARGSLRRLSEVPHRYRAGLAQRLRAEADRLDEALKGQYEIVERRKRKIIEEVTALIDEPDTAKAVEAAKVAQQRWKAAGRLRRGLDQKLWKEYRAAADQIFGRLDEQREQAQAERKASRAQLQELLNEARQLEPSSEGFSAARDQLHQRWREAGGDDRKLQQQFSELIEKAEQGHRQHQTQLASRQRQVLRDLEQRCHEAEQAVLSGAAEAPTVEPGELDLGHAPGLTQRLAQLGTSLQALSPEALEERLKQLQALCIRAEFLAGTDTPEPFHEERMSYQVKRLAERMTGEARQSLREEADELEALWLGNGPLPPGDASD
ncbi:MAG: DUF349 domain-containing protein, partial [Pseudomonadota bacterium]